jgi:hypothetical protein
MRRSAMGNPMRPMPIQPIFGAFLVAITNSLLLGGV